MRIIARLDVKPPHVVKPVHFEGLRVVGHPQSLAESYYQQGADELLYLDIVASLYQREINFELATDVSKELFTPFAVGGGIRAVDDVKRLIHDGADKVVLNTHAIMNPAVINEASHQFGAQAIVIHIEAKQRGSQYECFTDCGRNPSGKYVVEWAKEVVDRGAGEIVLSVIDRDGRNQGADLEIASRLIEAVSVPVVIGSGMGTLDQIHQVASLNPSGIAVASILHYNRATIGDIKEYLRMNGIEVHT